MAYKVGITDNVSDHMRREANWRSRIRATIALSFLGIVIIYFGLSAGSTSLIFNLVGGLIIVVTLLTFLISYSERARFKQTYEYHEKEK